MSAGALVRLLCQTSDAVTCDEFVKLDVSLNSLLRFRSFTTFNVEYIASFVRLIKNNGVELHLYTRVHNKINIRLSQCRNFCTTLHLRAIQKCCDNRRNEVL